MYEYDYDDIFDDQEIEDFDVDSLYYDEPLEPPQLDGCKRITSGRIYDMTCQSGGILDQDPAKNTCLLYACPQLALSDPIWNQRKNIVKGYMNKSIGCDLNKVVAGTGMSADGYRTFRAYCSKTVFDDSNPNNVPP